MPESSKEVLSFDFLKVAGAIIAIFVGTYTTARVTGHQSPNIVPAVARALPWPNSSTQNWEVPNDELGDVQCGRLITFLPKSLLDSGSTRPSHETISDYEGDYAISYSTGHGSHSPSPARVDENLTVTPSELVVSCPVSSVTKKEP